MENALFNEYLEKRYFNQLDYFRKASAENQKQYKNFQWILIILSTATTILAALPIEFGLQYYVVATAGIVTILTAGLKTFQYQELWVNYRTTAEELKPQIYYYKLDIGKYGIPGTNKEALFVETIENILNKERSSWQSIKNPTDQPSKDSLDELQKKLDELIKKQLNPQKPKEESVETEVNPPMVNPVDAETDVPAKPENTASEGSSEESADIEANSEDAEGETGEDTSITQTADDTKIASDMDESTETSTNIEDSGEDLTGVAPKKN
jgi:hypothetical protein